MTRRFTAQHTASGYSAMGGAIGTPILQKAKHRSVADAITRARITAMRMAAASKKKK